MNVVKLRIARRQVKIVHFRLIVELRRHHMHTAMQIHFDKAAELIRRTERPRIHRYPLLSPAIVARHPPDPVRHPIPRSDERSVVALLIVPIQRSSNIIAVKPQKSVPVARRRHRPWLNMIRVMPCRVLSQ